VTKEIVIQMIQNAESGEIGFYMKAALERYREVFPEWEIIYTALPKKDSEERRQTIHN